MGGYQHTLIGFDFSAARRDLQRLLIVDLLTPLVEAAYSYVFDRTVSDFYMGSQVSWRSSDMPGRLADFMSSMTSPLDPTPRPQGSRLITAIAGLSIVLLAMGEMLALASVGFIGAFCFNGTCPPAWQMWWIVIRLVGAPLVGIVLVVWLSRITRLDPCIQVLCILGVTAAALALSWMAGYI